MLTHLNLNDRTPKRVAVIGSSGFIGTTLLARLKAEEILTLAISSADIDLTKKGSDCALAAQLKDTDTAVMLSCRTPDKGRDLANTLDNLKMGYHFAVAASKANCQHVIYFSSDAVYADDTQWVAEWTKAEPSSPYGVMHLTREVMLRSSMASVLAVIRPTGVYGLLDTHSSYGPNRFRRMSETLGKITLFGQGEELRDHIFIDDLMDLTMRIIRRRSIGMMLGVTGRSLSFAYVAALVASHITPPPEIVFLPRANPLAPIFHRQFDASNTIRAFPDFSFTSIEEGIAAIEQQACDLKQQVRQQL